MSAPISQRLVAIVALGALGVGLAIAGNAVGTDGSVDGTDAVGELSMSGDNLTVSNGTREVVAAADLSGAQRVEVTNDDGVFSVRTGSDSPLTRSERDRAAEIARSNGTVSDYLRTVEDYSLDVQPIQEVDADTVRNVTLRESESPEGDVTAESSGNSSFVFVESDLEDDGAVTVARNRTYVDGEANVRVYGPGGELRYSLVVDLASGHVDDITDRREGRDA